MEEEQSALGAGLMQAQQHPLTMKIHKGKANLLEPVVQKNNLFTDKENDD